MPDTPFVAATFNMRRASLPEIKPSQIWSKRSPVCSKFLQKVRDAADDRYRRGEAAAPLGILAVQEAEPGQVDVAEHALGPNWTRVSYGLNINLIINTLLFEILEPVVRLDMKSGLRQRHAIFAHLESKATGDVGLFGVTHLAARTITEPKPETYRPAQMRAIGKRIGELGVAYGRPLEVVQFGDFNDDKLYSGIRKIGRDEYALRPIEDRLTASQIKGEGYECHHGYAVSDRPEDPATAAHPEGTITWICDALTKSVTLTRALVYRTDREVYPTGPCPSDHNLIFLEGTY